MDRSIRLILNLLLVTTSFPLGLSAQGIQVSDSFGTLQGDETEIFGLIIGAAFVSPTQIAVLDGRMLNLRLYDKKGHFLSQTGRSGAGPGEFTVPEALVPMQGEVAVLDRGNARISTFGVSDGADLKLDAEIPLRFQPRDLCVVDGRFFLTTDTWEEAIVEVDRTGRVIQRFGTSPPPPSLPLDTPESLQAGLAFKARRGHLGCSEAGLTWGGSFFGSISHYSLDGTLVFQTSLPGFAPVAPELTERNTVRYSPQKGSSHTDGLTNIVHIDSMVMIQALRIDFEAREKRIVTWRLDLDTHVARQIPEITVWLRDTDATDVLLSREDPYPQVLLGQWTPATESDVNRRTP